MSQEKLYESLSALMDGQASELELHQVLKQSQTNSELREQWQRWQRVRSALHAQPQSFAELNLAERVSAALDEAPATPTVRRKTALRSRLWRSAGQLAVAASVTLAVLGGVRFYQISQQASVNPPLQVQTGMPFTLPLAEVPQLAGFNDNVTQPPTTAWQWPSEQASWQEASRLRDYLRQHNRQSALNPSIDGLLPDVRAARLSEQ